MEDKSKYADTIKVIDAIREPYLAHFKNHFFEGIRVNTSYFNSNNIQACNTRFNLLLKIFELTICKNALLSLLKSLILDKDGKIDSDNDINFPIVQSIANNMNILVKNTNNIVAMLDLGNANSIKDLNKISEMLSNISKGQLPVYCHYDNNYGGGELDLIDMYKKLNKSVSDVFDNTDYRKIDMLISNVNANLLLMRKKLDLELDYINYASISSLFITDNCSDTVR